jgi:hypothetical protein
VINEIQHLFAAVVARPVEDLSHRLRWSAWPGRHQAHARTWQSRRQAAWDLRRSQSTAGLLLWSGLSGTVLPGTWHSLGHG